ncbi:metallophosphoesterase family protein [Methanocella arvoryzae]|uniref:Serine/threonine protein phosphatase n=1 Tax=Methanocella arvoryzae (strain DSM 22066 / NBRC 105507 / MRE50) TaxID=351160 RepID=Q0W412_METAR|nr:metallophosphoesterase family protein [Methanocella arvoryzae]CAJ36881.1 putative serine/threonine protein phosphatase [Methanocella arvoryzae MRE50]
MKLLLISDLHGNLEALNAVLGNVIYDRAVCMGDLVDYGPDPGAVIDWVRKNDVPVIRGNHDNAVGFMVDCGCGYKYKHLSVATREYTWKVLSDADMEFLRGLPLSRDLEIDGLKLKMVHGSPESFFDYLYPDIAPEKLAEYTAGITSDYLLTGHTHFPAVLKAPTTTVLNPGSVGQPRDKDWRASCMVLDTATRTQEIRRITYDIDATCRKIEQSMPLADELTTILRRGY